MDKLFECANKYKQLLSIQYNMVIGRKGKTINISVQFSDAEFVYLLGLHKLEDNEFIRTAARTKVFSAVLYKKITYDEVSKSKYFSLINNRFEPFSNIENLLDSNELIFRYNEKQNTFSMISKSVNEARCLPGTLEAIREEGVQIVVLNDPEIYAEYAPYEYILDMSEFIDCVKKINAIAS